MFSCKLLNDIIPRLKLNFRFWLLSRLLSWLLDGFWLLNRLLDGLWILPADFHEWP